MRISLSTIVITALVVAATEAAPHGRGRHGRPNRHNNDDNEIGRHHRRPFPAFPPGGWYRNRTEGGGGGCGQSGFATGVAPTGLLPTGLFPTGILPTGLLPTGLLPTASFSQIPGLPSSTLDLAPPATSFGPGFSTIPPVPTTTASFITDDIDTISFVLATEEALGGIAADAVTTPPPPAPTSSSSSNTTVPTPSPTNVKATTTFPSASGSSTLATPMTIASGAVFDGNLTRFGRGIACTGQNEGGDADAVFLLEDGATLRNAIIGADQAEGVHCLGSCTIENVWWEDVCEDALTLKQESGVSRVIGGGARGADDKVIQHNGGGTVEITGFYVEDFGKLYRSCGNCDEQHERHVVLDGVVAKRGKSSLVGINSNFGDTATITKSCITETKTVCTEFEGNDMGDEPRKIGEGISERCRYTEESIAQC